MENDPPFKIEKIGVRVGGPSGNTPEASVEAAPVNGAMSEAELAITVNDYLRKLAAKDVFSGGVLIGKNGKTVYAGSAGFADRSNDLQNGPSTRFNVGSIDKAFTKVAIEQLVARGKISFSDTIGKLLPGYPQAESRSATVDQLLHHAGKCVARTQRYVSEPPGPPNHHRIAVDGVTRLLDFAGWKSITNVQVDAYSYLVTGSRTGTK